MLDITKFPAVPKYMPLVSKNKAFTAIKAFVKARQTMISTYGEVLGEKYAQRVFNDKFGPDITFDEICELFAVHKRYDLIHGRLIQFDAENQKKRSALQNAETEILQLIAINAKNNDGQLTNEQLDKQLSEGESF